MPYDCHTKKTKNAVILTAFFLCFTGSLVYADAPGDQWQQQEKSRQEEQQRLIRQNQPDIRVQTPPQKLGQPPLPQETPSFLVHSIHLSGSDAGRFAWLQKKARQYENRYIGQQGLAVITQYLNSCLIEKGYITSRVLLPTQNMTQGTLQLELSAGHIGNIRFAQPDQQGYWQNAFPTAPGRILNLRDLEQGLEQMKRVPSQDADFKLYPGQNPGETDILITINHKKPYRLILNWDNSGSEATGKNQFGLTYSQDNLLGYNDLFHLNLSTNTAYQNDELGTKANAFYLSIPDGYRTYTFSYRNSRYKQTLPLTDTSLKYTGDSNTVELKIEQLLQRSQTQKHTAYLKLSTHHGHNYVNEEEILLQKKRTTSLEGGYTLRQYQNKAIWDFQIAYRHGMPWGNAQHESDQSLRTSRYSLLSAEINYTTPITPSMRYTAALRGQYTPSRLYANEAFSIGNQYTIRGFDGEQTLLGHSGWVLRNELAHTINRTTELYLAGDIGNICSPLNETQQQNWLLGTAVGIRSHYRNWNLDVTLGWPLKKPTDLKTSSRTLTFQLSYTD